MNESDFYAGRVFDERAGSPSGHVYIILGWGFYYLIRAVERIARAVEGVSDE